MEPRLQSQVPSLYRVLGLTWDLPTLKSDEGIHSAYAKALEEKFPENGELHLPTGAPVEPGFIDSSIPVYGPLIVGIKSVDQSLLDFLYAHDLDPRSIIFAARMLAALEKGKLAELFGEEVRVTQIQEVGDKHLCLYLTNLSPGALMGLVDPFSENVSGQLNYWQRVDGGIEQASTSFRFCSIPFNFRGLNDQLDKAGIIVATRLLEEGSAVIDCTKVVTLIGQQSGRTYKIVYKGFNPVLVEKFMVEFLKNMNLPEYKIHLEYDQYGRFAWVDYIESQPIDEANAAALLNKVNLKRFGEYIGWGYVFGFFDLNEANLLFSLGGNALTRIDLETALIGQMSSPFSNYLEKVFEDLYDGVLFSPFFLNQVTKNLSDVMTGTGFVRRHFVQRNEGDFGQAITQVVRNVLINNGARNRVLLQSTRHYLFEDPVVAFQLGGVIPYYETDVNDHSIILMSQRIASFVK